jgi:hypothetical protein
MSFVGAMYRDACDGCADCGDLIPTSIWRDYLVHYLSMRFTNYTLLPTHTSIRRRELCITSCAIPLQPATLPVTAFRQVPTLIITEIPSALAHSRLVPSKTAALTGTWKVT